MRRRPLCLAIVTVLIVVAGMPVAPVNAQTRSMPVFEVDRAWPKVPPQWRLGDPFRARAAEADLQGIGAGAGGIAVSRL